MNYIFFGINLIVIFSIAFTMNLLSKPHKNVLLENTLSPDHLQHPDVLALVAEYRRRIMQFVGILSVASLIFLFNLYGSILYALFSRCSCFCFWGQATSYKFIILEKCTN